MICNKVIIEHKKRLYCYTSQQKNTYVFLKTTYFLHKALAYN